MRPLLLVVASSCFAVTAIAQSDVAALAKQVRSDDVAVRLAAVAGLAQLGPKAASAVPVLAAALADRDPRVALGAGTALGSIGKPAFARIKAAFDTPATMCGAAKAVGAAGADGAELVPVMLMAFRAARAPVEFSELAQGAVKAVGARAVPHVAKVLADRSVSVHAANMLTALGPVAAPATDALLDLLLNKTELPGSRYAAAGALGAIGKGARIAAPRLLAIVVDPKQDPGLRRQSVTALERVGHDDPAAARAALQPFAADADADFALRVRAAITALK